MLRMFLLPVAFVGVINTACKPRDHFSALTNDPVTRAQPESGQALTPAQIFAASEPLFSGTVHELHVHMHSDTFAKVTTHKDQGGDACKGNARYGHIEKLVFVNKDSGEQIEIRDAGIRVRGNTSCGNYQKSFRLKFDADAKELKNDAGDVVARVSRVFRKNGEDVVYGVDDQKRIKGNNILGLKTFSLRASANDPTRLRDKVSSEIFAFGEHLARSKNLPGAAAQGGAVYRAGLVRAYFHMGNGRQDFGVYSLSEQVDKALFRMRWGKDVTFSFQANAGRADLRRLPENRDELFRFYEPGIVEGDSLEDDLEYAALKAAVGAGSLSPAKLSEADSRRDKAENALREFVAAIDAANSKEKLAAIIDVDNILSYMVAVNLTGHWDGILGNANNDHLVFNGKTKRWGIVVWDLDNSFGSLATGGGQFDNVWNAAPWEFKKGDDALTEGNRRPLFEKMKLFFDHEYRQRYSEFLSGVFDLHKLNDRMVWLRNRLTGGHSDDPAYQILFNFKNHRWAHGHCGIVHGKRAAISDGRPEFVNYEQKIPKCH